MAHDPVELKGLWEDDPELPVEPINAFVVQGFDNDLILSVGFVSPPLSHAPLSLEQVKERLSQRPEKIRHVRRFLIRKDLARDLGRQIQANLGLEQ